MKNVELIKKAIVAGLNSPSEEFSIGSVATATDWITVLLEDNKEIEVKADQELENNIKFPLFGYVFNGSTKNQFGRFDSWDELESDIENFAEYVGDEPVDLFIRTYVEVNGKHFDYDEVVDMMDDEIREYLHGKLVPCSQQTFVDAYAKAHEEKFNEEFVIN